MLRQRQTKALRGFAAAAELKEIFILNGRCWDDAFPRHHCRGRIQRSELTSQAAEVEATCEDGAGVQTGVRARPELEPISRRTGIRRSAPSMRSMTSPTPGGRSSGGLRMRNPEPS